MVSALASTGASVNMHSALENAVVVQGYLTKKIAQHHIIEPGHPEAVPACTQTSLFGVILKPHQHGKWHLIVNLSSPETRSVNDGSLSLTYAP